MNDPAFIYQDVEYHCGHKVAYMIDDPNAIREIEALIRLTEHGECPNCREKRLCAHLTEIRKARQEVKKMEPPVIPRGLPTRVLSKWPDFSWPDWVPQELRNQIEDFWDPSMHRGPDDWKSNWPKQLAFGEVATLDLCGGERRTGRFVHRWNNIGAVVHEDGEWSVVSFHFPRGE